ncbi:MAG: hypothetical protein KKD63_11070 [Proteobacteria bacterium]|nr:hypothetical protein [Desulfobulbaceae bacterium]MBU4153412.1 hypothetical protein [Pseudomonadota bacterium]
MIRLSAGLATMLLRPNGKSFADAFRYGVLRLFSGGQPDDANATETGTLLCEISNGGVLFTPGIASGGLNFMLGSTQLLEKSNFETWKGNPVASGNLGWFRFYDNALGIGASTTAVRFDGSIVVMGTGDLRVSHLDVSTGVPMEIEFFEISQPLQ